MRVSELPWVTETRATGARRRNPVWGVLALVAALVCGAMFLVSVGIAFVELLAFLGVAAHFIFAV